MTQSHFYSKPTSIYWTCEALIQGRSISHLTQINNVHGWRLGAIIHRLKTEFGWPICTEYTSLGHVALYRLSPDTDASKLRYPPSAKALGKVEGAQ